MDVFDTENSCENVRPIRNDDMDEGDYYTVKSDKNEGRAESSKQPAECSLAFNFGDRMASLQINVWRCQEQHPEPFLAIYSDCEGRRKGLLAQFNCTSSLPSFRVNSPNYCLTLYHYRGLIKSGYFFSLSVIAMQEMFSFPAGSIAAVVVSGVVAVMVILKLICVVTGQDQRLPEICYVEDQYKNEDRKKILFGSHDALVLSSEEGMREVENFGNLPLHLSNPIYATHPPSYLKDNKKKNQKTITSNLYSSKADVCDLKYPHTDIRNQISPQISPESSDKNSNILTYNRSPRSSFGNFHLKKNNRKQLKTLCDQNKNGDDEENEEREEDEEEEEDNGVDINDDFIEASFPTSPS